MRRLILAFLLLFMLPGQVWAAAPTYDNSVQAVASDNVATLETASFTIAGSTRMLVCGVGSGAGTPVDPSAVKWGGSGGTAMTKQGATVNVGANLKASLYTLLAPTATSSTVHATWGSAQDERIIVCISANGVDQSTPLGTVASASGTAATATVNATTVADDFVVDFVWYIDNGGSSPTITVGAGQTSRQEMETLPYETGGGSTEVATTTSTTMSWVSDGSTDDWGILAIGLKPDAGGGGGSETFGFYKRRPQ